MSKVNKKQKLTIASKFTAVIQNSSSNTKVALKMQYTWKWKKNKTGVINDPLGQIHNPGCSDHCFNIEICFALLCFEKYGRTDEMCETMITTGHDCWSAEWIKNYVLIKGLLKTCFVNIQENYATSVFLPGKISTSVQIQESSFKMLRLQGRTIFAFFAQVKNLQLLFERWGSSFP